MYTLCIYNDILLLIHIHFQIPIEIYHLLNHKLYLPVYIQNVSEILLGV